MPSRRAMKVPKVGGCPSRPDKVAVSLCELDLIHVALSIESRISFYLTTVIRKISVALGAPRSKVLRP